MTTNALINYRPPPEFPVYSPPTNTVSFHERNEFLEIPGWIWHMLVDLPPSYINLECSSVSTCTSLVTELLITVNFPTVLTSIQLVSIDLGKTLNFVHE